MLIDYDKTFPESARSLALDGAEILACLSAWPTSITNRAPRMAQDRQSRLFDLYDQARAAENQVVLVSSNQTGAMGGMRFLGQAKVVGPGGDILARTWSKAGLAVAELDVAAEIARARRVLRHLDERRPERLPGAIAAEDRAAELLDQAARRRRAHPRAGRGAGRAGPGRHGVDAGPGRRRRLLPRRSTRAVRLRDRAVPRRSPARASGRGSCGPSPLLRAAFDPAARTTSCTPRTASAPTPSDRCVRTVHHLDHFTTPELAACHERAIVRAVRARLRVRRGRRPSSPPAGASRPP